MIIKYKKKPIVVEAMQFNGANHMEIIRWAGKGLFSESNCPVFFDGYSLKINTLEGVMTALPNDYIIKGIKGEFYPCNSDVFAMTYEEMLG